MSTSREMYWNPSVVSLFKVDKIYAWLSPLGTIHKIEQYMHLEFFKYYRGHDKSNDIQKFFDLKDERYFAAASEWLEQVGDDHPEWHTFDGSFEFKPEEHVISKFLWVAYEAGWGRLGTYDGDKIELECAAEHARKLGKHARELAEMVGRQAVLTVVAPFEYHENDGALEVTHPKP